jgi:ribosome-associated protein
MDIRKLQRAIVDGLEDVKAQNIVVFNTEHLSPLFERVIVATGTSNRQTKALASSVRDAVKSRGMAVLRTEGEENGEWIIVDCGAAVVHLMQPAIRDYYHLEELWGGKSVKMKLDHQPAHLVKAAAPSAAARARAQPSAAVADAGRAGGGTAAKQFASKKAPARRGAAPAGGAKRLTAAKRPAAKAPAAKAPARKTAARTGPAQRATGAKRPATPKTVVRRVAAKVASKRSPSR